MGPRAAGSIRKIPMKAAHIGEVFAAWNSKSSSHVTWGVMYASISSRETDSNTRSIEGIEFNR